MIYIIALSLLALIIIFVRQYFIVSKGVQIEKVFIDEKNKAMQSMLKFFHVNKKKKEKAVHGNKDTQIKIYYTQAMASFEHGELNESKKHFEKVYKLDKNYEDASKKLGLLYLKSDSFDPVFNYINQLRCIQIKNISICSKTETTIICILSF